MDGDTEGGATPPSLVCDLCGSRTPQLGARRVAFGESGLTVGDCCALRAAHWPPSTVAPPRHPYGTAGEQLAWFDTLPYKRRSAGWRDDIWREWRRRVAG